MSTKMTNLQNITTYYQAFINQINMMLIIFLSLIFLTLNSFSQPIVIERPIIHRGSMAFTDISGNEQAAQLIQQYTVREESLQETREFRNYFLFDLSNIQGQILTAELVLFNDIRTLENGAIVVNPVTCGYVSQDPSETYTVFDYTSSLDVLTYDDPDLTPRGVALSFFEDLGSGQILGSKQVSNADDDTFINIVLNSNAISQLNNSTGELFALGGAITTIDPNSTSPEAIFQCGLFRDLNDPTDTFLRLTIAPDSDNDGVLDDVDNCPNSLNPGQGNADGDSRGGACDNNDNASDEPFNCTIDNDI